MSPPPPDRLHRSTRSPHHAGRPLNVTLRQDILLEPLDALLAAKSGAAAQLPGDRDDIRNVLFVQESSRPQLTELARLVDEGRLRPQVGAVYPLEQAAEAYSAKAAGGIPGRIVLQP